MSVRVDLLVIFDSLQVARHLCMNREITFDFFLDESCYPMSGFQRGALSEKQVELNPYCVSRITMTQAMIPDPEFRSAFVQQFLDPDSCFRCFQSEI